MRVKLIGGSKVPRKSESTPFAKQIGNLSITPYRFVPFYA